jgi:hypothetical protein
MVHPNCLLSFLHLIDTTYTIGYGMELYSVPEGKTERCRAYIGVSLSEIAMKPLFNRPLVFFVAALLFLALLPGLRPATVEFDRYESSLEEKKWIDNVDKWQVL